MLGEGVVRPPGGTRGDAMQQAGTLVNVLGQRSGHNLYLVDGVTVTDQHFNNMVISPSIERLSTHAEPESCWPLHTRYGNALSAVTW